MFNQKLQHAISLHQQGMLDEAQAVYQGLLKERPRDVNVLNFMGVLCFQRGRHQEGARFLRKCLQIKPDFAQAHNNLGNGLMEAGMLKDAVQSFSRAAALAPDYVEAHFNLANAYGKQKDFDRALLHARRTVELAPGFAKGWAALASALCGKKDYPEAVAAAERAAQLAPGLPEATVARARVLWLQEKYLDAVALYRSVIGSFGNDSLVLREFASHLLDVGRPDEALPHLERLATLAPDDGLGSMLLGSAYKALGHWEEAEAALHRATILAPELASPQLRLSQLLQAQGKYQEAESAAKRALAIDPKLQDAALQLVWLYFEMDRQEEGFRLLKGLLTEHPDDAYLLSQMIFYSNYATEHSAADCLQMALDYGQFARKRVTAPIDSWRVDRQAARLRVGLVTGDICEHPVGFFLQNVLPRIDKSRIELLAYPTQREIDALTLRLLPCFSSWKHVSGLSDQAAADMIRSDGVHVLIDLAGHTAHNRLPLFAWKPAPVQVSWLGYWATTGLAEIDYFIADEAGASPAMESDFAERIWRLPETRLCFSRPETEAEVAALPALANAAVTFGSFQTLKKLQTPVLQTWAKILAALPGARLRLQSPSFSDPRVQAVFRERFAAAGGDLSRLDLHGPSCRAEYLEAYREVDIVLDTFPFPGGTTTCEALWMGVPTLTLAGDSVLARQGASIMTAAGLPEWVADNETAYVAKALGFASDLPALAALRSSLRQRVARSALFDGDRFARNLEQALFGMWQAHSERADGAE